MAETFPLPFSVIAVEVVAATKALCFAKELAKDFTYIEFSNVLRQKNSAAHNIVRHARHVNEYLVWMKDVSPHLFFVIQASLASV